MIKTFSRWIAYDIYEQGGVMSAMLVLSFVMVGLSALAVIFWGN